VRVYQFRHLGRWATKIDFLSIRVLLQGIVNKGHWKTLFAVPILSIGLLLTPQSSYTNKMKKQLLALSLCSIAFVSQAQISDCSELFISEYVTGSGNNRAIELYNPTNAPVDLAGYKVGRFRDGSGTPMLVELAGTIPSLGTYVIVVDKRNPNGTGLEAPVDDALAAVADAFVNPVYVQSNSPFYFNGDDAVPLIKGTSTLLDIVGRIGEDPGTAWADANGTWWTIDKTLIRKATVLKGDDNGLDEFLPEVQWDSLPENTFTNLGWHDCDCANVGVNEQQEARINMYPNPAADKQLLVSANKNITNITVYNVIGQEAERADLRQAAVATHRFNLQHLATGMYVVRVELTDGAIISRKVMLGK
jgi:hypothetical protein